MYQFFDTLTDDSGNSLLGATVTVTTYPAGTLATIYSTNGTASPVAGSTVQADITGQVSFYAPDGAYTLTYSYQGTPYKTRTPVQLFDPMGLVKATDTGTAANQYVVVGSQYPATLYPGLKVEITPIHTNTGASTLAWQGGGQVAIKVGGTAALQAGMMPAGGITLLEYDGTVWQLLGAQTQPFQAQTPIEAGLTITPTNTSFPAYPYVDPQRYGADPTGAADSTAAVQAAINVAYAYKGVVWIGNGVNYKVGALSLTMTGNAFTDSLHLMGSSVNGSQFTQTGSVGAILTVNGTGSGGNPGGTPLLIETMTFNLSGNLNDAIKLYNCSDFIIRNVCSNGHNRAVYVSSSLTGEIESCKFQIGHYGVYCRSDGANPVPVNLLRIHHNQLNNNDTWGVDYDQGSELQLFSNDMEGNGATGNVNTGAIHIGGGINATPTFGVAHVAIKDNWIEANLGQTIKVDSPTLSQQTTIDIVGGLLASAESGRALLVSNCTRLSVEDVNSSSPGDTWNITAQYAFLKNVNVSTLTDTGVTYPYYSSVTTSTTVHRNGRVDSFTATLTGCTTSPTATVTTIQQGPDMILIFSASLTATSNTTACTFTGLPSRYQPSFTQNMVGVVVDNSAGGAALIDVDPGTGTVTANKTFTNTGTKGFVAGSYIRYRLLVG